MPKDRNNPAAPHATWDTVRERTLALPGVTEETSYGTPALKVNGKRFVRQHQDGESLVVHIGDAAKADCLKSDAATFYVTDHYTGYPYVLVRLAAVLPEDLARVLEDAWRLAAPKKVVTEFDGV